MDATKRSLDVRLFCLNGEVLTFLYDEYRKRYFLPPLPEDTVATSVVLPRELGGPSTYLKCSQSRAGINPTVGGEMFQIKELTIGEALKSEEVDRETKRVITQTELWLRTKTSRRTRQRRATA